MATVDGAVGRLDGVFGAADCEQATTAKPAAARMIETALMA